MKKILYQEQIIAMGLLLGFEEVTDLDMHILSTDYLTHNRGYAYSTAWNTGLYRYLQQLRNGVRLEAGVDLNSYVLEFNTNVRRYLEGIAGEHVLKYFESFNLENFMLRKIGNFAIKEENIPHMFCKAQQQEWNRMVKKGYISKDWNEDIPHQDYLEYTLSNLGRLQLFKLTHSKETIAFIKLLNNKHYDVDLLDDFLLTQDLTRDSKEILTIENFEVFCSTYDRAIVKPKQYVKK